MTTYVFAAPEPNRSAGSNGKSAAAGLSRTLVGAIAKTELVTTNHECATNHFELG